MQTYTENYNPYSPLREIKPLFIIRAGDGENIILRGNEIVNFKIQESIDLLMASLPMRKLTLSALNKNSSLFDQVEPGKLSGKKIDTWIGINGEFIYTGEFIIDSVELANGSLIAKITAYCIVKSLDSVICAATGLMPNRKLSEQLGDSCAQLNLLLTYWGYSLNYQGVGTADKRVSRPENVQAMSYKDIIKHLATASACWVKADRLNNIVYRNWSVDEMPIANGITIGRNAHFGAEGIKAAAGMDLIHVRAESMDLKQTIILGEKKVNRPSPEHKISSSWLNNVGLARELALKTIWLMNTRLAGEIKYRGDPCIEAGDCVAVEVINNLYWCFLVEEATLEYDGGLSGKLKLRSIDSKYNP